MVDVKIVVVSVVAMSFVFLQPGITAHPTNSSTTEDDYCSLLEVELEFQRVQNMRMRNLLKTKEQKINTLENERRQVTTVRALGKERRRLTTIKTPQSERRTLGPRKSQPVSVRTTFIGSMSIAKYRVGITKVEDRIYVLRYAPNIISVFEDRLGFYFITEIVLNGTGFPHDIVYSNKSKCVYITDRFEGCIWVMTTTGEHRLTKWLANVTFPFTLSLSIEGHLLVLREGEPFSQLEIYSFNASLIRSLQLPQDIRDPRHVVQTSTGNFIIPHHLYSASRWLWAIDQLTNDGQLIRRFIPQNESEKLETPKHLYLDSDNNRLFVATSYRDRVYLFDSNVLTWSQILEFEGRRVPTPHRLFYDASKKHLFVLVWQDDRPNALVFKIN